jgi:glycerol-3-phosphate dehydrogenase
MNRKQTLDGLRQSPKVDVCVLGGGINGLSVFRELALQGVNVLIVEKADYCSGASAALSRMVHGGLRYLENGEFSLVKESLVERDRLLRNAPHYVAPLPTTVPVFDIFSGLANGIVRFLGLTRRPSRRGAIAIKTGLGIYDFLTRKRALMPKHQFRSRKATLGKWPALNPAIRNSATYYDAWVSHPERIGIELLRDGLSGGEQARALNYATIEEASDGRYRLHDGLTGETLALQPRLIVNATGGWIDIANASLFPAEARPEPLMGGTKGSHLIIDNPALRDMLDGHMIYYENEDGRICILFPYLGKVLVGSTDIRVDDPGMVRCEADERDYILQSLAFVLPGIRIRPEEIVFQFSGVRPLPASKDSFTGRIPRDHFCTVLEGRDGGPPVLCMIGGKWTTFRSFGELSADMALDRLGLPRRIDTAERPLGGGRDYPEMVVTGRGRSRPLQAFPQNRQRRCFRATARMRATSPASSPPGRITFCLILPTALANFSFSFAPRPSSIWTTSFCAAPRSPLPANSRLPWRRPRSTCWQPKKAGPRRAGPRSAPVF